MLCKHHDICTHKLCKTIFGGMKRLTSLGRVAALAALAAVAGCSVEPGGKVPGATPVVLPDPPAAPREFRAAWVATVANIDWPSKPGLPVEEQQRQAIAMLDRLQELNMNAAILQVRTSADALYDSKLEPWSYYLTGEQGKAPEPYYDPLKFWIDEAHKRGIELHAWFNPFRAKAGGAKYEFAANHIVKANPELAHEYGGMWWMDPAEPAARQRSLDVFLDVVRRYDVDGIHIDDYFYPYPVADKEHKGQELEFPDDAEWNRYQKSGGTLSRADWRRDAINKMIHDIYVGTKAEKRWVKFGISPFGLPYGDTMPEGIKGFNQFEKLYADTILWLQNGWCDYWTPQLYWPVEQRPQSYPILLDYWINANTMHRNLWPGLFTSKVLRGESKQWQTAEVTNQIELTRWRPQATGNVHFSMKALMPEHGTLGTTLKDGLYKEPALVPASPWLGAERPAPPSLTLTPTNSELMASWSPNGDVKVWEYALWVRYGDQWHFRVLTAEQTSVTLSDDAALGGPVTEVAVSAVDRVGNESVRMKLARPRTMKYPWPGLTTQPSK